MSPECENVHTCVHCVGMSVCPQIHSCPSPALFCMEGTPFIKLSSPLASGQVWPLGGAREGLEEGGRGKLSYPPLSLLPTESLETSMSPL